jgi:hypothetical protein
MRRELEHRARFPFDPFIDAMRLAPHDPGQLLALPRPTVIGQAWPLSLRKRKLAGCCQWDLWVHGLGGEKAPTIDQCCNRESLAERWVGLCGQLRVWHRIARSEEILNHPYVTGTS